MDSWFMGNCRFSKLAPEWGEFYQVSGDLLLNHCLNDWIQVSQSDNSLKHFLFYFRYMEFECEAQDWSFQALEDVKELNSISKY
jgi:hypothetical protein